MNRNARMMEHGSRFGRWWLLALLSCGLSGPVAASPVDAIKEHDTVLVIRVGTVHAGDGQSFPEGMILVRDGKIVALGRHLTVPDGATVINVPAGSATPGLIDAMARVESTDQITRGPRSAEQVVRDLFGAGFDPQARADEQAIARGEIGTAVMSRLQGRAAALGCDDHSHDAGCDQVGCNVHDARAERPEEHLCCAVCGGQVFGFEAVGTSLASGLAGRPSPTTEQSSECVPHTELFNSIDPGSPDFQRLLAGGVTTAYCSPDSSAVIGPRGAIIRTGGAESGRVMRRVDAVKATLGGDPIRVGSFNRTARGTNVSGFTRRPNTRMGVTWVFRKSFHDTILRMAGRPPSGGADTPSEQASGMLARVLRGEVPLRIQARQLGDIETAFRLADEFGLKFVLEEGTDAYKLTAELLRREVPVIFGPIIDDRADGPRTWGGETQNAKFTALTTLLRAGVKTALTAQELREEDGLARQAMVAMRFGLSLDEALRAVTSTPAEILGIADQVGTLEAGKRADIILWSGKPFAATSRPLVVIMDGEVVLDRRHGAARSATSKSATP